jgi:hypothetical protein
MKRIFTFAIALLGTFAMLRAASATSITFNVTVPSPTYQCWIVGSFNGWNNALNQMTMVDSTHYTITMDTTTWAAGVTKANVQYKYCSGPGDWAYVEKNADGTELANNRVYTGTITNTSGVTYTGTNGNDVVVKWASVYNPNIAPLPMNVTIDVLTPDSTIQCYIVGTFNNWAGPTAPADSIKMNLIATNADGTKIFEKTIFTADANKLAYHFCSGPDWSFEQSAPTGDFKYPQVNPVVTGWKKVYDPSKVGNINVTATVPAGTTDVWVNGSFIGWNFDGKGAGGLKCTKNADGTFSFVAPMVLSIEYKMYNGQSWNNVEVDASGVEVSNRTASYPANANTSITVIGWKTPMAVRELDANKYKVYTLGRSIVVEGVNSQVDVFDVSGRDIQSVRTSGTFTSKDLNAGLYILMVDGSTRKVAVN